MSVERRYQVWVDIDGQTTLTILNGNASLATLVGAILAQSNSDVLNDVEGTLFVNTSPIPTAATYPSVRDSAILIFACGDGTMARVTVPAPKSSLFLSDGQTVSSTAAATLITDAIGVLVSASGSAATSFLGGLRQASTRQPL